MSIVNPACITIILISYEYEETNLLKIRFELNQTFVLPNEWGFGVNNDMQISPLQSSIFALRIYLILDFDIIDVILASS